MYVHSAVTVSMILHNHRSSVVDVLGLLRGRAGVHMERTRVGVSRTGTKNFDSGSGSAGIETSGRKKPENL